MWRSQPTGSVPSLTGTTRDAILTRLVDLDRDERTALVRLALAGQSAQLPLDQSAPALTTAINWWRGIGHARLIRPSVHAVVTPATGRSLQISAWLRRACHLIKQKQD